MWQANLAKLKCGKQTQGAKSRVAYCNGSKLLSSLCGKPNPKGRV